MITVERVTWGTADEIAEHLGGDVTPERVRDWVRRGLAEARNVPGRGRGTTYVRLDEAAEAERLTRRSTRGRKRSLDSRAAAA